MKKKNIINRLVVIFAAGLLTSLTVACGSTNKALSISEEEKMAFSVEEDDPVTISNEDVAYEIIIVDAGFHTWLSSIPKPKGYYSQSFLENRNRLLVLEWNLRAIQPRGFNPDLYIMQIDYQNDIDYGYEVNYMLYNYFVFFQRKYNQRLGPFLPRI